MKTISIIIPTYNEEENIPLIYDSIKNIFSSLSYYYEIIYIDNASTDTSRKEIEKICSKDQNVKAIYNAKNFGFTRSTFYGLMQGSGECTILIFADMQDPPEIIPKFIEKWESGYKVVVGQKLQSKENRFMFFLRKCYYDLIEKITDIDHIKQFTGFGLYDKSFIEVLKNLSDPLPYLRGIVAELGFNRTEINYEQNKRKYGKSTFHFFQLYDTAMLGITSYSKVIMRLATIMGFFMSLLCAAIGIVTLIIKLIRWEAFPIGVAAISVGVFLLGSLQLFFIGLIGEYVLNINTRVMDRPLVVEEKRINFMVGEPSNDKQ